MYEVSHRRLVAINLCQRNVCDTQDGSPYDEEPNVHDFVCTLINLLDKKSNEISPIHCKY